MIRLLWVRKMADAGIALDIRDAFATGMLLPVRTAETVSRASWRAWRTPAPGRRRNCGGDGPPCSGWSETGDVSEPKPALDALARRFHNDV